MLHGLVIAPQTSQKYNPKVCLARNLFQPSSSFTANPQFRETLQRRQDSEPLAFLHSSSSPLLHRLPLVQGRCGPRGKGFSSSSGTGGCPAHGRRPWCGRSGPSLQSLAALCIGNGAERTGRKGWKVRVGELLYPFFACLNMLFYVNIVLSCFEAVFLYLFYCQATMSATKDTLQNKKFNTKFIALLFINCIKFRNFVLTLVPSTFSSALFYFFFNILNTDYFCTLPFKF